MSQLDYYSELQNYTLLNYELEKYDRYLIRDYESLEKNHIYLMLMYGYQIPVVITQINRFDRENENTTTYVVDHIYGDEVREGKFLPPDYFNFPMKLDISVLYSEDLDLNEYGIKLYDLDGMYEAYLNSMSKLPIGPDESSIIGEYALQYNRPMRSRSRRRSIGGRKHKKSKRSTRKTRKMRPYKR